jgi:hypothetical protein
VPYDRLLAIVPDTIIVVLVTPQVSSFGQVDSYMRQQVNFRWISDEAMRDLDSVDFFLIIIFVEKWHYGVEEIPSAYSL